jgi:phosphoglycerate dehydrogenase-like enzyme
MPKLGKDKDKLAEIIGQYDGLAIRSATKVTEKLLALAPTSRSSAAPGSASTTSTSPPPPSAA